MAGISVRVRITATVAALVTLALAGAGLIVYVVESQRIDASAQNDVEQELDEFARLRDEGTDPATGRRYDVRSLLTTFLSRNVPDEDELLVGWVDGGPALASEQDPLVSDPDFAAAAEPLVEGGGTARIDTGRGAVRITSQPVTHGDVRGALLVVSFLDEERGELADTMRTYATVGLLSLLFITWAAWWQAGRLLAPLRTLRRTADEIGATYLARRVPATGNDDITALTRTINRMLDRLEAAFVGQRRFLDDAGHELKTPLTVLRGHLELLDPGDPVDVEQTRDLLLDEVDRMSRVVSDLIMLAKSDHPGFLDLTVVDPAELVTAVLAKARALGDRHWLLEPETMSCSGLGVVADEQRLTQALLQLADNAVKHTTPGQEIAIGASVDDALTLWVRDDGPGVPVEDRERIFERFGRSEVLPGDEGFGLGLSIVAAISRAHGGRAYVEDADPVTGGARFVIAVPVVRPEGREVAPPPTGQPDDQGAQWPAS